MRERQLREGDERRLQTPRRASFSPAHPSFRPLPPFFPGGLILSLPLSFLSLSQMPPQLSLSRPLSELAKQLRQRRLHRHRDHQMGVLAQEGGGRHRPPEGRLCRRRLQGCRGHRRRRGARRVPARRSPRREAARFRAGGLQPEGRVQRDVLQREAA